MRNAHALKSGLVGYVYRWLRNAGVVAVVSGGGLLVNDAYHAHQDAPAEATVTALEIACVLTGNSTLTQAYQKDIECSDADGIIAANPKMPLAVREITYARLSYRSDSGADYTARLAVDALGRPDIQRGESVQILYARANPSEARAVASAARTRRSALLLGAGVLMLVLIIFARKAAGYQSDVADEVAALQRNYQTSVAARAHPRAKR